MVWCFCHAISPLIGTTGSTEVREAGPNSSHVIKKGPKPSETPETPPDSFLGLSTIGLFTIHSVVYLLWGVTWAFPPKPECRSSHWTLCFVGFPHPQWIKAAPITSTNRHQNCHIWISSLHPWVVISFSLLSTFILSLFFYFIKQYFYAFMLLYFYR